MKKKIGEFLRFIYGSEDCQTLENEILRLIEEFKTSVVPPSNRGHGSLPFDQKDAFVITYGDNFQSHGEPPLVWLEDFCSRYLGHAVSGVHILPFFPYTSDDGFSVADYEAVNPDLGDWDDIERLGGKFKLMSDLVLNHCSASHDWFKRYLAGEDPYTEYFIDVDPSTDLSDVVRPRALPLLSPFETDRGTKHVWTTFSADQVDLNFGSPKMLVEMLKVMLFHVARGIQVIRLDAIAYLWKEIGSNCIHHEKTHAVVKLYREVLNRAAPWVVLLTETNVPHKENISYFGDGTDEAQMIYQFSLPPLTMDAFQRGDAGHLSRWASSLPEESGDVTYFNFLASHDGVGVTPTHGILSPEELDQLVHQVKERGGLVSYKATPKGDIPYELNINYMAAVAEESLNEAERVKKFLASQAVMLSMPGVPGIYVHSLIGSGNFKEGVAETGMNRTINREKLDYQRVRKELDNPVSIRGRVLTGYVNMLTARQKCSAFHPQGRFQVLSTEGPVFAVLRHQPGGAELVFCLINTSGEVSEIALDSATISVGPFTDLLSGKMVTPKKREGKRVISLAPWEVLWLR